MGQDCLKIKIPIFQIFEKAGLFEPISAIAQSTDEIALIVKQAIEADKPLFRYQTTEKIKQQAALRLVDITGNTCIDEWHNFLFMAKIF